jgi:hypothetical protein
MTDEDARKVMNAIIPDLMIQTGHHSLTGIPSLDATIWPTQRR